MPNHTLRRTLTLLIAAVSIGSTAVTLPSDRAAAAPVGGIKVMTLNVWGAGHRGRTDAISADVLRIVRAQRPNVIALQEVCHSQHRRLRKELGRIGYQATHTTTRTNTLCRDAQGKNRYGNSLFVLGGFTHRARTVLPWGANPVAEHTGREARAMVCATTRRPVRARVCATHLSPSDPDNATQLGRINLAMTPWVGGKIAVAGDYNQNLSPVLSRLPFGVRATNPRRIDHVISNGKSTVTSTTVASSDHRAVIATIRWCN